ncbi:MAG TPA: hypothetical protein VIO15_09120 [Bacteroidales bacterium]
MKENEPERKKYTINFEQAIIKNQSCPPLAGVRGWILKQIIKLLVLFLYTSPLFSQPDSASFSLSGYVSDVQSAAFESIDKTWNNNNLFLNRLNFKWSANDKLFWAAEMRNRLAYGDNFTNFPGTIKSYDKDNGIIDLSLNVASGKSYLLNANFDRLYVSYQIKKLVVTAGRQRINWGQTFAWNPNDIFNAYSFFDIDYIERPGSDAIRFQYYNTETSCFELAVKSDSSNKYTIAGLYRFNTHGFDIQTLAGIYEKNDMVAGIGWSGPIGPVSFRGEISYFRDMKHFADTSGQFLSSIDFDYVFPNSLTITAEYLYANHVAYSLQNISSINSSSVNAKTLALAKHNAVVQVSYPITPLFSSSLAGMYLPNINGYYISPSMTYSLAQNIDASLYAQIFGLDNNSVSFHYQQVMFKMKLNF